MATYYLSGSEFINGTSFGVIDEKDPNSQLYASGGSQPFPSTAIVAIDVTGGKGDGSFDGTSQISQIKVYASADDAKADIPLYTYAASGKAVDSSDISAQSDSVIGFDASKLVSVDKGAPALTEVGLFPGEKAAVEALKSGGEYKFDARETGGDGTFSSTKFENSAEDVGKDDTGTGDGGTGKDTEIVLNDIIIVSGSVSANSTVSNDQLLEVGDQVKLTTSGDGTYFDTSDTIVLGGVTYKFASWVITEANFNLEKSASAIVKTAVLTFVDDNKNVIQVLAPTDDTDLVGIQTVDIGGFENDGQLNYSAFTSNDNVTIVKSGTGTAGIHDLTDGTDQGSINGTAGADTIWGGPGDGQADGGLVIDDSISAGAGGDIVHAGDGDDLIYGDAGNDTIFAGTGDDFVLGGDDDDLIYGDAGSDSLYGGTGDDTLFGEDDSDLLYGDVGDDHIYGGGGDTVFGGEDSDELDTDHLYLTNVASIAYTGTDAGEENETGVVTFTDGSTLQFFDIEKIYVDGVEVDPTAGTPTTIHDLTDGSDQGSIEGTDGDDVIWGGPGDGLDDGGVVVNDTINANGGNDVVNAGDGDDLINGGTGNDTLYGGTGNDTIGTGDGSDGSGPVNLVQNGSFEDGTHSANGVNGLDGWTNAGGSPDSADDGTSAESWNPNLDAHDGTGYITMWSSNTGPSEAMTQTLGAPLENGTTYTVNVQAFSGQFINGQWFTPSAIDVEFQILDTNTGTVLGSVTVNGTDYEPYSFDITPTADVTDITIRPLTTGAGNNPSLTIDSFAIYEGSGVTSGSNAVEEPGDDVIYGEDGDDVLGGGKGADTIDGGDGDDTIYAGADDIVDGGEDTDETDVDVLYLENVASITYTGTDPGEENETGRVVFDDGSSMDFANIEEIYVDGVKQGGDSGGHGSDVVIYDLIQLSGGVPAANTTLTTAGGDLVEVDEPITFNVVGNVIDAGDTATIDGVEYVVSSVHTDDTAVVTFNGGTDTTNGGIEMGYITLAPTGGGASITYMVPIESPAVNLPDISQIVQGDAPGLTTNIPVGDVDGNENVTLATPATDITVTDIIITSLGGVSDELPTLNQSLTVDDGDLVSIAETATVSNGGFGNSANLIEAGDTFTLNGVGYDVSDIQEVLATINHEDSSGNDVVSNNVLVHNVSLQHPTTGDFITVAIPVDGDDFEAISSITITQLNGQGDEITDTEVDDDDLVSLDTSVEQEIHDLIVFSGNTVPANGSIATTLAGDMTAVEDGVTATMATPGQLVVNDTITIDGVDWNIDSIGVIGANVTHDDNNFGTTVSNVDMYQMSLSDGSGNTLILGAPVDGEGNLGGDLPDITQIEFVPTLGTGSVITLGDVDTNETVTLATEEQVVLHDMIQLSGGLPATGTTQTTLAGDLVEVDDNIIVTSQATPNMLSLNDTVEINGVEYLVADVAQVSTTMVHDDQYGIPTTSSIDGVAVQLSPSGGGASISYIIPHDGNDDVPEIQSIVVNSYTAPGTPVEIQNAANTDIDNDDFVTLAGDAAENTAVFDLIQVQGFNPANMGILATDAGDATNGELISVSDSLQFDLQDDALLQVGDTTMINGVEYTVIRLYDGATGDVTHDDPVTGLPTTTSDVSLMGVALSDGAGTELVFVGPYDSDGDLPQITQIDYDATNGAQVADLDIETIDTNDIVTLESAESPPIYDIIITAGGIPAEGATLLSGTQLISVEEPLTFNFSETGQIEPGATFVYGGQTYQVDYTEMVNGDITQLNGSVTNANMAVINATSSDGDQLTFTIPADIEGDLPQIVSIEYTTFGNTGTLDLPVGTIDDDDNVALADLPELFDLIELSDPSAPTVGYTANIGSAPGAANGDIRELVEVDEPVTYLPQTVGQVTIGDTFIIGGEVYTLTAQDGVEMDITYNNGATTADNIIGFNLTLTNGDGETLVYTTPASGEGDFPNITSITYVEVDDLPNPTPLFNFNVDDTVTLGDPAEPDDIPGAIYDAILLQDGSLVTQGNTLVTSDGDLQAVIEPLVFNQTTPNQLDIGTTVEIGGETYSITSMNLTEGDIQHDPTTVSPGGETIGIELLQITVQNAGGDELSYIIPWDGTELPEITQIEIVEPVTGVFAIGNDQDVDSDDTVTLAGTEPLVVYDMVELSGIPAQGSSFQTGTTGNTLVEVDEPLVFNVQSGDGLQLGDTIVLNGEVYTVTDTDQWNGTVYHTDPVTDLPTTSNVSGAIVTVDDGEGNTVTWSIPFDDFTDLPEITQIDFTNLDNTVDPLIETDNIDTNDFVTLAEVQSVYDAILTTGTPATGEHHGTTGTGAQDGTLVSVNEPLVFDTAVNGQVSLNDTIVIGGETYTVTNIDTWSGTVTHLPGGTGTAEVTVPNVDGTIITVTNGGVTQTFIIPNDDEGPLPNITDINFTNVSTGTQLDTDQNDIDTDNFVTLICFARGTRIATPRGEVAVEDLREDDMVLTRDAGIQPVRWVGSTKVAAVGKFAPITIKAGALGNQRDLQVSPQHRMLINDWRAEMMFGEAEFLVAAKHLVNGDTIFAQPGGEVEYFHILFDTHQMVFSEGVASESFHPGVGGVAGLHHEAREELFQLFPELQVNPAAYGPSARSTLKGREAKLLMSEIGQPEQAMAAE